MERSTLAVDCTEADFRTFETALYQVLHRTTINEPLRMVQEVQGQKGFEAWHLIGRRYDQRNTSDRSSKYAALISNISERDRAKDVENSEAKHGTAAAAVAGVCARHGHHNRLRNVSAAIAPRNGRCDTAVESGSE